ncbi:CHAT domain-containing protein [Streptomyces sp. NPDC018972]|uniref:CHAT domain-containing protein n=1 Tax=Streptomyces sp. NPDC018972 TaxID=3365060 RepID=UPI0037AB3FD7
MNRTVLAFEPVGMPPEDQVVLKLEDAPTDIPEMGCNAPTDVSDPGGSVTERGMELLARLALHPPVRQGLEAALRQPAYSSPVPLYFRMVSSHADRLPWEQLCDAEHDFIALDPRWPIVRIASRRREVTERGFSAPLRLVAVLSAAGRSAVPQAETLLSAVCSADAAEIGVHLHIISGEREVLQAAAAAGLHGLVTTERIPTSAPELVAKITEAQPDILHMLCHGGASGGVKVLAFAHFADFDAAAGEEAEGQHAEPGSVRLKLPQLISALKPCDPWLVVLSACQSAQVSETQALAHALANGGIPAVAGMRRQVDLGDADQFCAALYPEVLAAVREAVSAGTSRSRELNWATVFTNPRIVMAGPNAKSTDGWSDPVLYVQNDPLRIFPGSDALSSADFATLRGQLDFWESYVAFFDPRNADPVLLAHAREKITELRDQLGLEEP